ncbi:glycosyltransferase family 4 protein [Fulvivirgaceae bacterium BMA10]|uniref:Glycosyltransferase family 4 protein n=1 Tax=Splendidivirga corallicola TaxID=3051826 RepID=A0ABT8KQT2_9BACT|nr:glycosyltransferase family 4 protein [Fulvivirgaceae bacterium BMA10]
MKIAIVVNSFPTISESFIVNKVIGLNEKGFEITVIAFNKKNDASFYRGRLKNKRIKKLYVPNGNNPFQVLGYFLRYPIRFVKLVFVVIRKFGIGKDSMKNFLKAIPYKVANFDIVHFEMSGIAADNAEILDLIKPAKLYLSCRGSAEKVKPLIDQDRRKILNEVFQKADRVHCVSEDMLGTVERYGLKKEKGFINRPAIFPDLFHRSNEYTEHEQLRILTVGRLNWQKGYVFALKAMQQLKADGLNFLYEIIGAGEDLPMMTYLIDEFKLQDHVLLLGKQSGATVRNKLESSDVFLLPSLYEGISNAALEAMAMEVPVLSTKSGGMEEAIDDGMSGYLVECASPEQIAHRLHEIASDFENRKKIGQGGKEKILKEFQMSRQVEIFDKEYRSN